MHTIASGYIKNRKCSDILIKTFKDYKKQNKKHRVKIDEKNNKIKGLVQIAKDLKNLRNELLEQNKVLESNNEELKQEINHLEQDCLQHDLIEDQDK